MSKFNETLNNLIQEFFETNKNVKKEMVATFVNDWKEFVNNKESNKESKKKEAELPTKDAILSANKNELIVMCRQLGLTVSGKKEELLDRILKKMGGGEKKNEE